MRLASPFMVFGWRNDRFLADGYIVASSRLPLFQHVVGMANGQEGMVRLGSDGGTVYRPHDWATRSLTVRRTLTAMMGTLSPAVVGELDPFIFNGTSDEFYEQPQDLGPRPTPIVSELATVHVDANYVESINPTHGKPLDLRWHVGSTPTGGLAVVATFGNGDLAAAIAPLGPAEDGA